MSDQPLPSTTPATTQSLDEILNQLEKTTSTQSAPVAMSSTNLQPTSVPTPTINPQPLSQTQPMDTPVATIAENAISPLTPTSETSAPAPMVKEEPHFDANSTQMPESIPMPPATPTIESTPVAEPVIAIEPIQTPEPTPKTMSNKRPWSMNKIAFGVAGVLVLAVVIGVGYFLTQQNQDNRMLAVSTATPMPTATAAIPSATPTATPVVLIPNVGIVSGTFCDPKIKFPGTLYTYNVTNKQITVKTIFSKSFRFSLPIGPTMFMYQPDGSTANIGYTDSTHHLKSVSLTSATPITNLQLCDPQVNQTSIPNTYAMVQ